jgi:hypothetical protein
MVTKIVDHYQNIKPNLDLSEYLEKNIYEIPMINKIGLKVNLKKKLKKKKEKIMTKFKGLR